MSVYDINGAELATVYGVGGTVLTQAYDIDGNPLLSEEPTSDLVFMTYNVQRFTGRNGNQTMQERIMNAYKPDIVGLQELGSGTMPALGVTLFADYPYQTLGSQTNKTGVVSKIALDNPTYTQYVAKASETRGYNKAYITVNGKRIAFFNTHLEVLGGTAHTAQAKELFDALQEETSFIAVGDYNVECHSTNDAEYTAVVKQFIDAGYNLSNWTAQTGFVDTWFNGTTVAGSNYVCPCDNIITSPDITIESIVYDPIKLEYESGVIDHIAVIAHLQVGTGASS